MKLVVFHISDIHLSTERYPDNPIFSRVPKMIGAVRSLFLPPDEVGAVLMLVAGDIAHSGMKAEYDLGTSLFDEIRSNLAKTFPSAPLHPIFLPGNHDCNFKKDDQARQKLIEDPDMESLGDGSVVDAATTVQGEFFDFCGKYAGNVAALKGLQRLYTEHEFEVGEKQVVVRAINSAWLSKIPETRMLMLPIKYLADRFAERPAADLGVCVTGRRTLDRAVYESFFGGAGRHQR